MSRKSWIEFRNILCPNEIDTLFLQACLLGGTQCSSAYVEWIAAIGSPLEYFRNETSGRKRLLPLLERNLREHQTEISKDFKPVLRAAYFHEELRAQSIRSHVRSVFDCLKGLDFLVLRGVALAESVYDQWALRHCHDLDLWIRPSDKKAAEDRLVGIGLILEGRVPGPLGGSSVLRTGSGFQVSLHTSMLPVRLFEPPIEWLLGNKKSVDVAGIEVGALSDADMLMHICGIAAFSANRRGLQWACDAVYLLGRSPDLDWEYLMSISRRAHLAFPLSMMFEYLERELDAPIPCRVIEDLSEVEPSFHVREELYHNAHQCSGFAAPVLLKQAPSRRARLSIMRCLVLPSLSHLRREKDIRGSWSLVREYILSMVSVTRRLGNFLVRRIVRLGA